MKRLIPFLLAIFLTGCAAPPAAQPTTLTVFAAASLADAFAEISTKFEAQHPGLHVQLNLAGSQQLARQIASGAPADVFASASRQQMDAAGSKRLPAANAAPIFARNRLVVILPASNPGKVNQLTDLARPGLIIILAAKEVPAGQYSLEFLQNAARSPDFSPDFAAKVLKNTVSYEENVRSVLTKISLGEADAGIVYSSDAPPTDTRLRRLDIPAALNVTAEYPIAALTDSPNLALAQQFIDFVRSPEGQAVLAQRGFAPGE